DEGPPAETCGWEGGAKTPFSYPLARRCHYFIITALTRRKRASTCPAIRSHLRRAGGGLTGDQRLPLPLPGCESRAHPVRRQVGAGEVDLALGGVHLQAEAGLEEEEDPSGCPRLRRTGHRVEDRTLPRVLWEPAEQLRHTVEVEV